MVIYNLLMCFYFNGLCLLFVLSLFHNSMLGVHGEITGFLFFVVFFFIVLCLRIKSIHMQRARSEESQKCPEGILEEPLDLES